MDLDKELRAIGFTQTAFAKEIDRSRQQVNLWCNGKHRMNAVSEKMVRDKIKELSK